MRFGLEKQYLGWSSVPQSRMATRCRSFLALFAGALKASTVDMHRSLLPFSYLFWWIQGVLYSVLECIVSTPITGMQRIANRQKAVQYLSTIRFLIMSQTIQRYERTKA